MRSGRLALARTWLKATRDETRGLIHHPGLHIEIVHEGEQALRANRIQRHTQVNGLGPVQRADRGQRPTPGFHRWISENGDRDNVISHIRRHRSWSKPRSGCCRGGDEIDHARALRISTEHNPGAGTVRGHVLDTSARILCTRGGGVGIIIAGRVIDCVHPDRPSANLRAQRVDKCLSNSSNTRLLAGAACKHHLDVRA